jgi:catechol 2,3-dioxygenase-like lactoylglutathione lyase family enzyme
MFLINSPGKNMIRLEHANLSVVDADAMTRFLQAAASEFRVRGEGVDGRGRPWRHVGNDEFYVALQTVPENARREPYGDITGLNHLGWEVDDLDALEARMQAAGFSPNMRADEHPARDRRYFYDPDGNDWEFVCYHSERVEERNDYSR